MPISYNASSVVEKIMFQFDVANPKCYSPNVHPYPTDLYAWVTTGNQVTLSRDTITSPVGNKPLKMVQNGNDTHTGSYNTSIWNLCPATIGEVWTVSVWVKASAPTTVEGPYIFEVNSAGTYIQASSGSFAISTEWQRISLTRTFTNATTAYIQTRLDGTNTGGAGITIWWDGLQVERTSSASNFNSTTNTNGLSVVDSLTATTYAFPNTTSCATYNKTHLTFDGTDDYISLLNDTYPAKATDNFSCEIVLRVPSAATWSNGTNAGSILTKGSYPGITGFIRDVTNNQIGFYARGNTSGLTGVLTTLVRDTWEHYVGTYDGYNMVLYKNGVQVNTGTIIPVGGFETGVPWWLGSIQAVAGADGNRFRGDVAIARAYKKCLSALEVEKNFISIRGRFGL